MPHSAIEIRGEHQYRSCASALIFDSASKVLLLRKDRPEHAWQAPQGGVNKDETIEAATIREVKEETGLKLEAQKLAPAGEYLYDWSEAVRRERNGMRGQIVHLFIIDYAGDTTAIQLQAEEVVEYRWVTREELCELITNERYRNFLLAAMDQHAQNTTLCQPDAA